MKKFNFTYYICFLFFLTSNAIFSKENSVEELERINKEIFLNEKTYKSLKRIEKNLFNDLNKTKQKIEKYKHLIKKGFLEKERLEKVLESKKKELEKYSENRKEIKKKEEEIFLKIVSINLLKQNNLYQDMLSKNIYKNVIYSQKKALDLENKNKLFVKERSLELRKINKTLSNIRKKLNLDADKIDGIYGETVIAAIEKQETLIKTKKIKDRASEIKKLIEDLENKNNNNIPTFIYKNIKDLLPVTKPSIDNMAQDKLKTGILLTLKRDSILKTPKDSLVVYANNFKGYGNMIILDLGNNYHLIYSGLSNILCKRGDWIEKGSIIGEITFATKEIYMEVRHKGKIIKPKDWIKS